jgi:hypothetical protein
MAIVTGAPGVPDGGVIAVFGVSPAESTPTTKAPVCPPTTTSLPGTAVAMAASIVQNGAL